MRLGTKLKTLSCALTCFWLYNLFSILPIIYMKIVVLYYKLIHLICYVSLQALI